MNYIVKVLVMILMTITSSLYAAELEPLKQFINRKPLFFSDKNDTEMLASRCSTLYLVLGSRIEAVPKSKEMQDISKEYADRAVAYDQVREVISKVTKSSITQQKEFAQNYANMTLINWKKHDDIFKGMVNDDLDVCQNNYIYFKKLAVNLSK